MDDLGEAVFGRVRLLVIALLAGVLVVGALVVPAPRAVSQLQGMPPGFVDELVVGGLPFPTAFAFLPDDRMLIALKSGIVRVVKNGSVQSTPFIDIRARVHDNHDRGLLGLAVHPEFPEQPYVYLLYTYDPPGVAPDQGSPVAGRVAQLLRVRADAGANFERAVAGSETVLLGQNSTRANIGNENDGRNTSAASCMSPKNMSGTPVQDCIPSDENSHTIGTVVFGPDGSLYVSSGDASNYGGVDPRAMRAQHLDSLAGKVLRIDPMTGAGLADNPFFQPGSPNSNRSKVFSLGLRNPFRMAVHPQTGEAWIGDVGWSTWEEVNTGKGANFGWPCYEGGVVSGGGSEGSNTTNRQMGSYRDNAATSSWCSSVYQGKNPFAPSQAHPPATPPVWAYDHSGGGASANAGAFYLGSTYPEQYRNRLFVADYNRRWVKALLPTSGGGLAGQSMGVDGGLGPVQVQSGPDTNIYWLRYGSSGGEVRRIRYTGAGNTPPVPLIDAAPTIGTAPLTVAFDGGRSYDPDAQELDFSWEFGDGATSTQKAPTHTYTELGVYDATLTVTERTAPRASQSTSVRITVGHNPPLAQIVSPADGSTYRVGDVITFSGRGTRGGEPLPAGALSWELRHGHNEHFHYSSLPSTADPGDPTLSVGSFTVDDHGDNTWYELCLTATVDEALTDVQCVELRPEKTAYTVLTEPAGLTINYEDEGTVLVGPAIIEPVIGSQQTLTAPQIQRGHTFVRWDDGSTQRSRTFVTGQTPTTLTAVYENRPPTVQIEALSSLSGPTPLTVSARAVGSDPEGDPLEYAWADGKGGTSQGATTQVTYTTPGTYQLSVVAHDAHGGSGTASVTVTVTDPGTGGGLPAPWSSAAVGAVTVAGSSSFADGVFSSSVAGADIWGTADQFRFVSQPWTGDGELVARVRSLGNTDPWAKAGVMVRESAADNARHVSVFVTPGNGVAFQRRTTAGDRSWHTAGSASVAPRWVRLVRSGSLLTGYESADGVVWTRVGEQSLSGLAATVQVGLAVTSHNTGAATTATFSDVALGPPRGG
ncbi:MAG TPA: PQQ-dependent sugar dehydrogenase [Jiangellales bacterium]|nr:PQQ-dependent sugar dehydrogenase [Jiangellales bacterium]